MRVSILVVVYARWKSKVCTSLQVFFASKGNECTRRNGATNLRNFRPSERQTLTCTRLNCMSCWNTYVRVIRKSRQKITYEVRTNWKHVVEANFFDFDFSFGFLPRFPGLFGSVSSCSCSIHPFEGNNLLWTLRCVVLGQIVCDWVMIRCELVGVVKETGFYLSNYWAAAKCLLVGNAFIFHRNSKLYPPIV